MVKEREQNHQESFSIDGFIIGGPKNLWKPIASDGKIVKNAWEFVNIKTPSKDMPTYLFSFPMQTLIDIYVEHGEQIYLFTAMGGTKSILNHLNVVRMELYSNSPDWDETHVGKWNPWTINNFRLEPTNAWYPIGYFSDEKNLSPIFEDLTKVYPKEKSDFINIDKNQILKSIAAGILVLGGITFAFSQFNETHQSTNKPNSSTAPNNIAVPNESSANFSKTEILGQTTVHSGDIVRGDIYINGIPYMDNKVETGLVIAFNQDATVVAPYGAELQYNVKDRTIAEAFNVDYLMNKDGCGIPQHCSSVTVLEFPKDSPQGQ